MSNEYAIENSGGFGATRYRRITFNNGTIMVLVEATSGCRLYIYNKSINNYGYIKELCFIHTEEELKEYLQDFNNNKLSQEYDSYILDKEPFNEIFELAKVIENKGKLIAEMSEKDGFEETIKLKLEQTPDNTYGIITQGLWNDMREGKLTTAKEIKEYLHKAKIYGSKDKLQIYENLVYLKLVGESELY